MSGADHTLTFGNCLTDGRKREILENEKYLARPTELCSFSYMIYLVRLSENDLDEPFGERESANEKRCLNCDLDTLNDGNDIKKSVV